MRKLPAILAVLVLVASMSLAMALKPDETIPSDWIGKTKVINRKGELTQVVFIKYAKGFQQAVSPVTDIGDPDGDGAADGYELSGFYWNLSNYPNGVPYVINPKAAVKKYKLNESDVVEEIKAAFESWDIAVDYDNNITNNITYENYDPSRITYNVELYNDTPTVDYKARPSIVSPDFRNVVTWRGLPRGIVAVTSIWYTGTGEIVDADMILSTGYRWGIADGDESTLDLPDAFDIRNIVAHESGHWTGLDDIYNTTYWAMTMYGYADYGEEIKRTLEPGDIAGAQAVYADWR